MKSSCRSLRAENNKVLRNRVTSAADGRPAFEQETRTGAEPKSFRNYFLSDGPVAFYFAPLPCLGEWSFVNERAPEPRPGEQPAPERKQTERPLDNIEQPNDEQLKPEQLSIEQPNIEARTTERRTTKR